MLPLANIANKAEQYKINSQFQQSNLGQYSNVNTDKSKPPSNFIENEKT